MYCLFCGNNPAPSDATKPCAVCLRKMITQIPRALPVWTDLNAGHTRCCGGLSSDGRYLYFHGKHWDDTYQGAWCEYGVRLHADRAMTYAILDSEHYVDSVECGEPLPYPEPDDEDGWNVWYDDLQEALMQVPMLAHDHIIAAQEADDAANAELEAFEEGEE